MDDFSYFYFPIETSVQETFLLLGNQAAGDDELPPVEEAGDEAVEEAGDDELSPVGAGDDELSPVGAGDDELPPLEEAGDEAVDPPVEEAGDELPATVTDSTVFHHRKSSGPKKTISSGPKKKKKKKKSAATVTETEAEADTKKVAEVLSNRPVEAEVNTKLLILQELKRLRDEHDAYIDTCNKLLNFPCTPAEKHQQMQSLETRKTEAKTYEREVVSRLSNKEKLGELLEEVKKEKWRVQEDVFNAKKDLNDEEKQQKQQQKQDILNAKKDEEKQKQQKQDKSKNKKKK